MFQCNVTLPYTVAQCPGNGKQQLLFSQAVFVFSLERTQIPTFRKLKINCRTTTNVVLTIEFLRSRNAFAAGKRSGEIPITPRTTESGVPNLIHGSENVALISAGRHAGSS